jgi:pimeloyl-ACP methyl ester carboxylesterase
MWCHGGLSSRIDAALAGGAAARNSIRLIALDRPGIGRSTHGADDGLLRWPGIVAECADHLGLDTFAVAGWSAGGAFALACAYLLPERVRATATVAGMYPVSDPARRHELGLALDRRFVQLSQRSSHAARMVLQAVRFAPDDLLWRSTLRTCGPAERAALVPETRPTVLRMVREAFRQGTAGVVADYRTFGSDWGFPPNVITAPVTVFHGEADGLVPLAQAERLADDLPAGTLVRVPDAGHFLHATHGELIMSSLRSAAG